MPALRDTIFALSSGRPPAAIAVVRISGPRAGDALKALASRMPEPRKAALARVRDPASGEVIDEALALWFPGPNSETGEDIAELQLHGGRAVIAAALGALGRIEGLRPAEAGEFTRRAFENGRLDLTAVEGLADLIGAETEAQRRQAYRQLKGLLGDRAETWRGRLIEALALVEARIDFSDEADVPEDLVGPALKIARELRDEIAEVLAGATRGERLRDGLVVAIAGPPNAGKSTLLNRIAKREAAIVSPVPGTTRDVIEIHLDLDGYPVTLLDTAGIRDSDDPVEQEGVRRARQRASEADLVLWVQDAKDPDARSGASLLPGSAALFSGPASPLPGPASASGSGVPLHRSGLVPSGPAAPLSGSGPVLTRPLAPLSVASSASSESTTPHPAAALALSEPAASLLAPVRSLRGPVFSVAGSANPWIVRNKIDLLPIEKNRNEYYNENEFRSSDIVFNISATVGTGLLELVAQLAHYAKSYFGSESGLLTRERHRSALISTKNALDRALAGGPEIGEEIVAEELRLASQTLGRLTGRVDVEDILGVIFRDFCIGK